ncbi:non-hydrolyzing UDP-N-acetylglucosamine 2-epimerase [uncultured Shimia sp.]|uniref:non-hydrolyzing UDP-N-acetylglucosamine 2-epimerase n=1 Tax=uncultured Shimia sp. TaxID=573152 RepID=UPI0026158B79|nr:UDP-N-acetylglucosamine 2-epimerase (non-hydrolyzing) [uncultured Shimia sp.]
MKLLTVIGARPQFIKAATVSRVVAERDDIREIIVHTGQHYDKNMSDVFFEELAIPKPDYHLGIGGGPHGQMTGRQLEGIEEVLLKEKPDILLVYGDTNSTLAGALAAVKLHIPVAHVEAGLRSYNRKMPEEINRVLTDHAADHLFAPTQIAVDNLESEGIADEKVHLVGDVMYDAAVFYRDLARKPDWFDTLPVSEGGYVLATIHRAENTDDPKHLAAIIAGLGASEKAIVLPLHPRTRMRLNEFGIEPASNIHIVDPVGYLEMVWLEMNCSAVATDSGGVQKEAFFHGKPCITLRGETEWGELVTSGWNRLVGAERSAIATMLTNCSVPEKHEALYGDSNAALKTVNKICKS